MFLNRLAAFFAVMLLSVSVAAADDAPAKKDDPKPAADKPAEKDQFDVTVLRKAIEKEALRRAMEKLPAGAGPEEVQEAVAKEMAAMDTMLQNEAIRDKLLATPKVEDLPKAIAQQVKEMEAAGTFGRTGLEAFPGLRRGAPAGPVARPFNALNAAMKPADPSIDYRLGVKLGPLPELLLAQMKVPEGKGLAVVQVLPNSAAGKAGIKPNDILLELNGKPVPREVAGFGKTLEGVKPNDKVDAVVMRAGKTETLKDIVLPEAAVARAQQGAGKAQPALPANPVFAGSSRLQFTGNMLTYQQGNFHLTVLPGVANGPIIIRYNNVTARFDAFEEIPEPYREKVKGILAMFGG